MTKASGESSEAMEQLGVSMFDAEGNIRDVEEVFKDLAIALSTLTKQEQVQLINMIGGKTQAKTLQKLLQGMVTSTGELTEEYIELKKEIEQAPNTNALEEMSNIMTDNLGGDLKIMISALKESAITLFKEFEPQIREAVQSITNVITKLTEKLKDLSPEQKDMIINFAKFMVVAPIVTKLFGGLLGIVGNATTGIGFLVKAFGNLKSGMAISGGLSSTATAIAGVGTSASTTSGLVSGLSTALGGITTATVGWGALIAGTAVMVGATAKGLYDELNRDCIPSVDLFADKVVYSEKKITDAWGNVATTMEGQTTKISEATKQAVGAYMDLDDEVTKSLLGLHINSTVITQDIVDEMSTKFETMGNVIKESLNSRMEESTGILQTFFDNSSLIQEKHEQRLLEEHSQYYLDKIEMINRYQEQIDAIYQKACDENRKTTEEENDIILALKNRMREEAVQTLSDQEIEANIILERMKDNDTRITAETVSENIKKLNEARDERVAIAEDEYEKTLAEIYRMRDESKVITADQADLLIEEAKRQRDGIVEKADDTRKEALKKMEKLGKDVYDQVDEDTGKILSVWDRLINKWESWFPSKKTVSVQVEETSTSRYGTNPQSFERSVQPQSDFEMAVSSFNNMQLARTPRFTLDDYQINGGFYSANSMKKKVDKSSSNDSLVQALVQQNQLLMQLLTSERPIEVGLNVDGRTVAKSTAKYMDSEIATLTKRKNRLGGFAY